ncbi:MAG: PD-(D/E)XK nuclease family protein [bacterium]|nr:PD-(D/E)XK nuclease family protein [bacterium]
MAFDKYTAVWVSHSSMGDFLKCPRAYYLHNVYKDPKTKRKVTLVNGPLSLGHAVHMTLESLKTLPVEGRLARDLFADYELAWESVAGKRGGFTSVEEEAEHKARGHAMIERVVQHPGPLGQKTVRLPVVHNDMPHNIVLSEPDNIILCGLIDWLEYIEADDSIRVIDFKTGKHEEGEESLQLPIYLLLLGELQKRRVSGAAYWYLEKNDAPTSVALPDATSARENVLAVAKRIKAAREEKQFECPRGAGGCFACRPFEAIVRGEAEYVGASQDGRQDVYSG